MSGVFCELEWLQAHEPQELELWIEEMDG